VPLARDQDDVLRPRALQRLGDRLAPVDDVVGRLAGGLDAGPDVGVTGGSGGTGSGGTGAGSGGTGGSGSTGGSGDGSDGSGSGGSGGTGSGGTTSVNGSDGNGGASGSGTPTTLAGTTRGFDSSETYWDSRYAWEGPEPCDRRMGPEQCAFLRK